MEQIITMLKKSIEETGLNISDETLFSEAVKIYVSMGIQKGYSNNIGKTEITQNTPQKQEITPVSPVTKTVNPITPSQFKALVLMSKDLEGEEYLKSKGIRSEKDLEKLSKKEAWQIMNERK
jgi:hypothetical protein